MRTEALLRLASFWDSELATAAKETGETLDRIERLWTLGTSMLCGEYSAIRTNALADCLSLKSLVDRIDEIEKARGLFMGFCQRGDQQAVIDFALYRWNSTIADFRSLVDAAAIETTTAALEDLPAEYLRLVNLGIPHDKIEKCLGIINGDGLKSRDAKLFELAKIDNSFGSGRFTSGQLGDVMGCTAANIRNGSFWKQIQALKKKEGVAGA